MLLNSRFSPYVALPATGRSLEDEANQAALRTVLRDKTILQVGTIIRAIEAEHLDQLPHALQSMALENHNTLKNIRNMLLALSHFLTDTSHADIREKLAVIFRPIDEWVHGQYCVTTPALLVVQAILYSHCEWFREELFESYSAVRTYEELEVLGFPAAHRYFIAGIIAHQTILRAAWTNGENDTREVFGVFQFNDGNLKIAQEKIQDEVIGVALQRTLFRFAVISNKSQHDKYKYNDYMCEDNDIEPPKLLRRQLAAALVLHALCLQCRHSRYSLEKNSPEFNTKIKQQALSFLDHILATERKQQYDHASVAFFQYGRYVFKSGENENLLELAKNFILKNAQNEKGNNHTFCFPRVTNRRIFDDVWIDVYGTKKPTNSKIIKVDWNTGYRTIKKKDSIIAMVQNTVGNEYYYKLHVDSTYHILKLLGVDSDEPKYNIIKSAIEKWESNQ